MKSLTPLVIPGHARARLVAGSEIAPRLVLRPLVYDPSNVGDAVSVRGHAGRRHVVALRRDALARRLRRLDAGPLRRDARALPGYASGIVAL